MAHPAMERIPTRRSLRLIPASRRMGTRPRLVPRTPHHPMPEAYGNQPFGYADSPSGYPTATTPTASPSHGYQRPRAGLLLPPLPFTANRRPGAVIVPAARGVEVTCYHPAAPRALRLRRVLPEHGRAQWRNVLSQHVQPMKVPGRYTHARRYQPITMFDSIAFRACSRSEPVSCM